MTNVALNEHGVGRDDAAHRRDANRAVGFSAAGLALTGLVELLLAVVTGSVALLGDAIHNLSDVSTSAVVFLGFRVSRKPASRTHPYGYDLAERGVRRIRELPKADRQRPDHAYLDRHGRRRAGHRRQPGRRLVQAADREADWLTHPDRGRPALVAGRDLLARRPDRAGPRRGGVPVGRPGRRVRDHRIHLPRRL